MPASDPANEDQGAAALQGAEGYLLKEAEQDDIVRAVHGVVAGEATFGPGVAARVLGYFAEPPRPSASTPEYPFPQLTDRERLGLDLLAQGRRTSDIAAELFLSAKTVSNHLVSETSVTALKEP